MSSSAFKPKKQQQQQQQAPASGANVGAVHAASSRQKERANERPKELPKESPKVKGGQQLKPNPEANANTSANPLDKIVASKQTGWKTVSDVAVPVLGWGAFAAFLTVSMKMIMKPTEPTDWKEAKAALKQLGFPEPENFDDDPILYILFRDLVLSCHPSAQESINNCGFAFQYTDSLLKLESTLRYDATVTAQMADNDRAEKYVQSAIYCLECVQHGPSQRQYDLHQRSKERLADAIYSHMHRVRCLVAKES